jgi:hypothetical protein
VQPDTTDSVNVLVEGNKHFVATYHAETVTVTQDEKVTTYNWKDPGGCVTPSPVPTTPEPPVGGQSPNLPETGASLTSGIVWSSSVLLLALLVAGVGGVLAWRRRRQQTTA